MRFGDVFEKKQRGYSVIQIYVGILPTNVAVTQCNRKLYLSQPEILSVVSMFVVKVTRENIAKKLRTGTCVQSTSSLIEEEPLYNMEDELNLYLIKKRLTNDNIRVIDDLGKYIRDNFSEKYKDYVNFKKGYLYQAKDGELYTCIGFKDIKDAKDSIEKVPTFKTSKGNLAKIFVSDMFFPEERGYVGAGEYTYYYLDYSQLKEKYKDYEWYL